MSDVTEKRCPGTLIVHLDDSAWCSEPGCDTRSTGEAAVAVDNHLVTVECASFFSTEGCPACRDVRHPEQ